MHRQRLLLGFVINSIGDKSGKELSYIKPLQRFSLSYSFNTKSWACNIGYKGPYRDTCLSFSLILQLYSQQGGSFLASFRLNILQQSFSLTGSLTAVSQFLSKSFRAVSTCLSKTKYIVMLQQAYMLTAISNISQISTSFSSGSATWQILFLRQSFIGILGTARMRNSLDRVLQCFQQCLLLNSIVFFLNFSLGLYNFIYRIPSIIG